MTGRAELSVAGRDAFDALVAHAAAAPPLAVDADLSLSVDGRPVRVVSDSADRLRVEFDSLAAARRVARAGGDCPPDVLAALGLSAGVHVRGRRVATVGADATRGVWRVLGLDAVRPRPVGLVAAAVDEFRAAVRGM